MKARKRHTSEWWFEPRLPKQTVEAPRRLKHLDPLDPASQSFIPKRVQRTGSFAPSNRWLRYNRLQPFYGGYVVELYSITCIAKRYGLSHAGARYFKTYLLPEPFGIVRRRATQAHHYSRFVLMALDVVLKDLENRGYNRFLKTYEDHVELVRRGAEWMADYYEDRAEQNSIQSEDKFGVVWYE